MQTRPGAGSALVGFVEGIAFTSKGAEAIEVEEQDEVKAQVPAKRASRSRTLSSKKVKTTVGATNADRPVTVLSSTTSFLSLVPSLLSLPASNLRPGLAIHVSAQASSLARDAEGSVTLTQVPELGALFEGVQSLEQGGWNGAVVLSETAQEAAQVGTGIAQAVTGAGYDLVNVFDGLTAGRQLANLSRAAPVAAAGQSLATILGAAVPPFTYSGSATATQVLVLPASTYSSSAKAALAALTNGGSDVGIVTVRVVKPWSADAFLAALPTSTKTLHVFAEEDSTVSPFYEDILTTLLTPPGFKLKLKSLSVPTAVLPTVQDWASTILALSSSTAAPVLKSLLPEQAKLAVFWDLDSTSGLTHLVPSSLAQAFAASSTGVDAKLETKYDNFRQGGVQQATLLLEPTGQVGTEYSLSALAATSPASLLFLSSPAAVLKAYEPISLATVGPATRVVISANWTSDELTAKLPVSARKALATVAAGSKGNLFIIDADKLAAAQKVSAKDVAEIVFWSLYLPATISAKEIVTLLASNPSFASWDHAKLVEVNSAVRNAIVQADVDLIWTQDEMLLDGAEVPKALPSTLVATAASVNPDRTFAEPISSIIGGPKGSWHQIAHRLLFPEAFAVDSHAEKRMRPDLPEKNFMVTVTENRRLTPSNYDRNVFHLEFSTVGTGLHYAVGEALGIHGWNDEQETLDFLSWYGLDPEAIISAPAREDPTGRVEQRTVFQVFQQMLDIFGKPGKSFYETLSRYATNKDEERALRFIACPDGHATFKKMSDVDTLTYADVMRKFPSARPSIEDLVREIETIKPRHYSIASSQNFVGDSVHLLIVTVEWQDPKGASSLRFCRCAPTDTCLPRRCRSLRTVHSLPQQPQGRTAGYGLGQALRHEGLSLPCQSSRASLITFPRTASSHRHRAHHHGWSRNGSCPLPRLHPGARVAEGAGSRRRPLALLLWFASSLEGVPLRVRLHPFLLTELEADDSLSQRGDRGVRSRGSRYSRRTRLLA